MLASIAEAPSTTTPSVATLSPGRTTNRSPTASWSTGTRVSRPRRRIDGVRRGEPEQRLQRGPGPSPGARLGEAAGEHERGHPGGDLEVDVRGAVRPVEGEAERVPQARRTRRAEEQRVERPAEGGERPDRHEGVHGGGGVAQVGPRRSVERQGPHTATGAARARSSGSARARPRKATGDAGLEARRGSPAEESARRGAPGVGRGARRRGPGGGRFGGQDGDGALESSGSTRPLSGSVASRRGAATTHAVAAPCPEPGPSCPSPSGPSRATRPSTVTSRPTSGPAAAAAISTTTTL